MIPIFDGNYAGYSLPEFLKENDWNGSSEELSKPRTVLLYASYDTAAYEGSAVCLYMRSTDPEKTTGPASQLYSVYCSHCSCYGLEHFDPEEESIDALLNVKRHYRKFPASILWSISWQACQLHDDCVSDAGLGAACWRDQIEKATI